MPTITLNKKVFETLVGKELPLDELKDRISMLGTDLESIEGDEIQVEIFPNRPDMLSEQGFARAFSSFIGEKTGLRKYKVTPSDNKMIIDKSVKSVRPFTVCAIVKNLKINEEKLREIIQIQEKLHITFGRNRKKCAIGIYPLEKIEFPVRYKADKPENISFQPLESPKELTAKQILEEHQKGKEFAHLLSDKEVYPFFIDNKDKILSMPPIINSQDVGCVTDKTKDIFIECSGFDFNTLSICLNIIVTSLADMGGDIYSMQLEYEEKSKENKKNEVQTNGEVKNTPNLTPSVMQLDVSYANKLLGLSLSEKEVKELLERMGYEVKLLGDEANIENKGGIEVSIPAYRADILHPVDLVEDVAIAYGYENFIAEIPNVGTIGKESKIETFFRKVREILVGARLLEVKNYHLTTADDLTIKMNRRGEPIPLQNALGEHNHLRNSLLPCLMKNLQHNQHYEYPQNIFEIGTAFTSGNTETGVLENKFLAITIAHEKGDFTEGRQIVDLLLSSLGLEYEIREYSELNKISEQNGTNSEDKKTYIEGRSAKIIINSEEIGEMGELHPEVLENWELLVPVMIVEMDLIKVEKLLNKK